MSTICSDCGGSVAADRLGGLCPRCLVGLNLKPMTRDEQFYIPSPEELAPAFPQLEVEERYTLLSQDVILYQFTLTDPAIYSEPVTVEKTISRRGEGEHIYEYACHEGNYSFSSILAGARRLELEAEGL